jgi:hypothetical protein
MNIFLAGRSIGKSYMAQMWNQMQESTFTHSIISQATVDEKTWYTIKCNKSIGDWIRQSQGEGSQWYEHIDHNWVLDRTMFDVHEEFYMMLKLKWGL